MNHCCCRCSLIALSHHVSCHTFFLLSLSLPVKDGEEDRLYLIILGNVQVGIVKAELTEVRDLATQTSIVIPLLYHCHKVLGMFDNKKRKVTECNEWRR